MGRKCPSSQMQKETWTASMYVKYQAVYMLFVMKITTDLIHGITKGSNLQNMEKCLFKFSCQVENSVRIIGDLNVKRRIQKHI